MSGTVSTLKANNIGFAYSRTAHATGCHVLRDVSFDARLGECWGIIGPNGAGKSTLLRILAGLLQPTAGGVSLNGTALHRITPKARARQLAYLPQRFECDPSLSAEQVVLLGRYPFRSLGLFESAADYEIARAAMQRTDTLAFADRPIGSLSGGETQRVHLAAVLAQQPQIILLDEPTTALDWKHQLAIFDVIRTSAAEGKLVIVVTHDLNLAARYCDRLLLIHAGQVAAIGSADDVLTPEILTPVYNVAVAQTDSRNAPSMLYPVAPTTSATATIQNESHT